MFTIKRASKNRRRRNCGRATNCAGTNRKVFRCSSFSKMLPRCGRVAHICEANSICNLFFLLQLHFLELSNSQFDCFLWDKLQIRTRQRGNCSKLVGKSRGGTPFCRILKIVFPKSMFHVKRSELILGKPLACGSARLGHIPSLPWESQLPLKPWLLLQPSDFKGNCDSFDFLLDFYCISFESLICFANVGCSPTPRQHFWKTAAPKNFYLPAARILQPVFNA